MALKPGARHNHVPRKDLADRVAEFGRFREKGPQLVAGVSKKQAPCQLPQSVISQKVVALCKIIRVDAVAFDEGDVLTVIRQHRGGAHAQRRCLAQINRL